MKTEANKETAGPRWLRRVVRVISMRWLAGQALGGMMSNPEWMKFAKEEASEEGRGDVPHQFAYIAVKYAERTIDLIEEGETDDSNQKVRDAGPDA